MKRDASLRWRPRADAALRLRHTRAIVVGGTGGIGRAFARRLAAHGAQVTVVGRSFRDAGTPGVAFVRAELSSMREAEATAKGLPAESADLLVFTTGIIAGPVRQATSEGVERDMAVSYLNRFVMLREMAPRLGRDRRDGTHGKPRVFIVGFPGAGHAGGPDDLNAERTYKAWPAHLNTVAANEALALDVARRCPSLACFGLNPGLIRSDIRSNFFGEGSVKGRLVESLLGWFAPSTDDYARRLAPLFVAPEIEDRSGAMFDRRGRAVMPSPALTPDRVERFGQASAALAARAGSAGLPPGGRTR